MSKQTAALLLAAAAAAGFTAAPAQAAPTGYIVSVSASDLNLASAAGRRALDARIDAAADRLCGYQGVVSLRDMAAARDCRDTFVKSARSRTRSASVAAAAGTQLASR